MMFILRLPAAAPPPALPVKASRNTPALVADAEGLVDYFCLGEAADIAALREAGGEIIELRDGWYAGDGAGGVAISGHGKYWEVRDTPFTVREASGPGAGAKPEESGQELVNVRGAIFGV